MVRENSVGEVSVYWVLEWTRALVLGDAEWKQVQSKFELSNSWRASAMMVEIVELLVRSSGKSLKGIRASQSSSGGGSWSGESEVETNTKPTSESSHFSGASTKTVETIELLVRVSGNALKSTEVS